MVYILINGTLYHHGIKGQKWGIRNGPPYPLKDNEDKFRLTDKQKKYIKIGLAVAGASLTIYGAYKISNGNLSVFRKIGESISDGYDFKSKEVLAKNKDLKLRTTRGKWNKKCENSPFNSIKDIPRNNKQYVNNGILDAKELLKNNNPGYPLDKGTHNNCFSCVTNIAMRMKGFSCSAAKTTEGEDGWSTLMYTELFKGAKAVPFGKDTKEGILSTLSSQGDGAYGAFSLKYDFINKAGEKIKSDHGVFYYIQKGNVRLLDPQSGIEYNNIDRLFDKCNKDEFSFCRLDLCEPTDKVVGALDLYKKG